MPPPAMRHSPGKELRADNSLEPVKLFRDEDEDLALFDQVQSRERENFLVLSDDDVEDIFSTNLSHFSHHILGFSVPVHGENSDLLNADDDKNDYDWLISPPDTPLFTSLDDDTTPDNLAQRGSRPPSQQIIVSRSSKMEKSYKSRKGSACPNCSSTSPPSCYSTGQDRASPCLSPTPIFQSSTPLSPSKPSSPAQRSITPKLRNVSISTVGSSGLTSTSLVKTSKGNSAHPKPRVRQSGIQGFSSEAQAPLNLGTSLTDRSVSYARGSSPASINGRGSPSKSGRQSMTSTVSRGVSSSDSHDWDQFNSNSKHSYGGDVVNVMPLGSTERSSSRRVKSFPNNKAPTFIKKSSQTVASSSAPKRSFDSALQQMDHRKSPENMFRPLLSSVPSSTLYVGNIRAVQHAFISGNSSATTSSHASSDQATIGAHDFERSADKQEGVTSAYVKNSYLKVQDEVFAFKKDDALNGNIVHRTQDGSLSSHHGDFGGCNIADYHVGGFENVTDHATAMTTVTNSEVLDVGEPLDVKDDEDVIFCPKCGRVHCPNELTEGELKVCRDCCRADALSMNDTVITATVDQNSLTVSTVNLEKSNSFDVVDISTAAHESLSAISLAESRTDQLENIVREHHPLYSEPIWNLLSTDSLSLNLVEDGDQRNAIQQVACQPTLRFGLSDGKLSGQKMHRSLDYPRIKLDASQDAGISVLLSRSTGGKGEFLQTRSFGSSSISYDDLSYVRSSACSLRGSYGHGSVSTSSSLDLGSCRQTDTRFQRQVSGRNSDIENFRCDLNARHCRSGSSSSGTSNYAFPPSELATSMHGESYDLSSQVHSDVDVRLIATQKLLPPSENMVEDLVWSDVRNNYTHETMDVSTSESLKLILDMNLEVSPVASFSNSNEPTATHENGLDLTNDWKNMGDAEVSVILPEFSITVEENMISPSADSVKVPEDSLCRTLENLSEIENPNAYQGSNGAESDLVCSLTSKSSSDELCEPHIIVTSDNDNTDSFSESYNSAPEHGSFDESSFKIDVPKARILTLEEATDIILFCSSIIHTVACDAATTAIEKEKPDNSEGSGPVATVLGKTNTSRKDHLRRTATKHDVNSPKRMEAEVKPLHESKIVENTDVSTTHIIGFHNDDSCIEAPPKLESKCNCTIM